MKRSSSTDPLLCFSQDSSPTSWSLCLRSGTASPSPARSARPWWATCTRTRPAGAAYDTHTHLQTQRRTPTLTSLSLKEVEEKKRGKTSRNLPPVSSDVLSSFVNGGEDPAPCLSSSIFSPAAGQSEALRVGALGGKERGLPLLERRTEVLQGKK